MTTTTTLSAALNILMEVSRTSDSAVSQQDLALRLQTEHTFHALSDVYTIVDSIGRASNITDWPFEFFWDNPYETRHSKLLAYFINPEEKHGCGIYLLKTLFQSLGFAEDRFPVDDKCSVRAEKSYIDILIKREREDARYAIIIENKIKDAPDQDRQLERYVDSVLSRGFLPNEIEVIYLPLTQSRQPLAAQIEALKAKGITPRVMSFKNDILAWLDASIDPGDSHPPNAHRPPGMREGMQKNLEHYADLLRYMVRYNTRIHMKSRIHELLKQAHEKNTPPSLTEALALQESSKELVEAIQSSLRGALLINIQDVLISKGETCFFVMDGLSDTPSHPITEYDTIFTKELMIRINGLDGVDVAFVASTSEFYWGYIRSGKETTDTCAITKKIAIDVFGKSDPFNSFLATQNADGVTYESCTRKGTAEDVANKLLDLRNRLREAVKLYGS